MSESDRFRSARASHFSGTNASKPDGDVGGGGGGGDDESWRHRQPYAPISSAADPYNAAGYYGNAGHGTAAFQYQAFGVGDGTWSANGTDPMTFLGGYVGGHTQPDAYAAEGVFGPTTPFSAAFGHQPFNYFHGNGDYSAWGGGGGGQPGRAGRHDDYLKTVEAGVRGLALSEIKPPHEQKEPKPPHDQKEPKRTWATIAGQPAKPQPPAPSAGPKKKGPGMPPPPIVPGKHNMDIGAWDAAKSEPAPVQQAPPPPRPAQQHRQQQAPPPIGRQPAEAPARPPPQAHPWAGTAPRAPAPRPPQQQQQQPPPPHPHPPTTPPSLQQQAHPVLDKLRTKNNYNPAEFDLSARDARFFVIKSYSEDDIHRSIKYEIWCSTEHGNKRLDTAYRERTKDGAPGVVYLFFSVNGSGHFCGMAQMVSPVDYKSNSSVWAQDKWKGQFKVRWVYVKDVPNMQLRHIRLENNENKPVTNSRDTQEIPHARGLQVLRLMHGYRHSTSIFDDFVHYEKRQEEEDMRKAPEPPAPARRDHHQGHDGKHDKGHFARDHGGGGFGRERQNEFAAPGFKEQHGGKGFNKDQGNNGEGYGGGGGFKGHRDRDHGGNYREHREQSGGGGGFRPHKERGDGSSRGGRGRGRPN